MNVKQISIIIAVAVMSVLTWWAARSWLAGMNPFTNYIAMVFPALVTSVLAGVTGLAWMLLERPMDRLAAILASWASYMVFFSPDIWYLAVLPIFVAFWYVGSRRIQHEIHERQKLRVWSGLDRGVRLVLLGIYVMISLGFYLLPISHTTNVTVISKGLQSAVQSTYGSGLVQSQLNQLPASEQAQVKGELSVQINAQVHQWLDPLEPYLPLFLTLGVFLVLWGFSVIFRILGLALAVGLFSLLESTGFVHVGVKDVKADVVTL